MAYSLILQMLCASPLPFRFFRVIATFRVTPLNFFFIHIGALSGTSMNFYKKPYWHRSLEKNIWVPIIQWQMHKTPQTLSLFPAYYEHIPLYSAYPLPFQSPPRLLFLFICRCLALVTAYQVWAQANRASHRLSRTPAI